MQMNVLNGAQSIPAQSDFSPFHPKRGKYTDWKIWYADRWRRVQRENYPGLTEHGCTQYIKVAGKKLGVTVRL